MAEVLDRKNQEALKAAEGVGQSAAAFSTESPLPPKKKKNRKKRVKRLILLALAAVLVAAFFALKHFGLLGGGDTDTGEVLTDVVSRGSITSMVKGSGAAVAKNSASITLLSGGQVLEIYVSEGDYVHEGDPLYAIESKDAQERVNSEQKNIDNLRKQLDKLNEEAQDLNVRADYAGILMDVADCPVGEEIAAGTKVATLVDNSRLLLPLYFSYAYEDSIRIGQSAEVSIPAAMAVLPGTVYEIHKVQRVSDEGGKLFEVVVAVDNPGTLTEKMAASATLAGNGETIYPYGSGALGWFRSKTLKTGVTGECSWSNLHDYLPVRAGESVLTLTADSSENEIASLETQIRSAEKTLEDAKKNLDSLNPVSPIDGTVLSIGITAGEEAATGTVAVSIADTTTMIVNAQVDEMNISYAEAGMPVNIQLWEEELYGVIDSVSLTAKAENGVARFPIVISVDNSEGKLMSGAYVDYSFIASQNDDCLTVPIQCVKSAQKTDGETCKVLFVQGSGLETDPELAMDMMDVPAGFYPVIVETGISDSNHVEIRSGVEEGATVYTGTMSSGTGMGLYF